MPFDHFNEPPDDGSPQAETVLNDATEERFYSRWYDQDPALVKALDQLRAAPDKYQAQVALNIIKVIIEHQIEDKTHQTPESFIQQLSNPQANHQRNRRWYDAHETLASSIQLLNDCPDDLQKKIIPTLATMIEATLEKQPG